jgi:drug/metabolite transporter (DMT)-like permease
MDFLIIVTLGVLGAALVAGGFVAYRRSERTGVKAMSAAAIAAGIVMWAVILVSTPVSQTTSNEGVNQPQVDVTLQR